MNPPSSPVLARVARSFSIQVSDGDETGSDSSGSSVGDDELKEIGALLRALDRSADPRRSRESEAANPPARSGVTMRAVERVRRGILNAWEDDPDLDAAEVRGHLSNLERIREELHSDPLFEMSEAFAETDSMALVVELAHDLRSPLSSILFLSDTLRRGQSGEINDLQETQLGLIYSAALGMVGVANDVMELAKSGSKLVDEDAGPFALSQVFGSIEELVEPMAEQKGVELRFELPEHDQFVGPSSGLGRILLNLATNALKFTQEGYVRVSAVEKEDHSVEFSVRDTGRGIPEDAETKLFDAFRNVGGDRGTLFSRSGLGLAICQRLLREMGSELDYETRQGWGTRFHFTLDLPPYGDG